MAAASANVREGTLPPVIGKAGSYTVFVSPAASPRTATPNQSASPQGPGSIAGPDPSLTPRSAAAEAAAPAKAAPPAKAPPSPPPPLVQVPPQQLGKASSRSSNSMFGFFWDAVGKVQDAHSSLDEYLADWLGLNQSKYQWALNDYHENKGTDKESGKTKDLVSRSQNV